jgi:hypothetical protein
LTLTRSKQPALSLIVAREVSDKWGYHQPVSGNGVAPGTRVDRCLAISGVDWPTLKPSSEREPTRDCEREQRLIDARRTDKETR